MPPGTGAGLFSLGRADREVVVEDRCQGGDELGPGRRGEWGEAYDVAGHGQPDDLGATRLARSSGRSRPTRDARGRSSRRATRSRIVAAACSSEAAAPISPVIVLRPSGLSRMVRMNSATRRPSPRAPLRTPNFTLTLEIHLRKRRLAQR